MDLLNEVLGKYQSKGYEFDRAKEIKSGKEATVYVIEDNNCIYALKIYINPQMRSFQATDKYTTGKFSRKKSARRAIGKKNKFAKRYLHKAWVRREYYLLKKLEDLNANTPKVYEYTDNSVLMEFVGDSVRAAPRMNDIDLTKKQAEKGLDEVLRNIELFLEIGIVHSDLSFYNILWWQDRPVIIDIPQAIDIRSNPNRNSLLKRDLDNVIKDFSKYIYIDTDKIYERFGL